MTELQYPFNESTKSMWNITTIIPEIYQTMANVSTVIESSSSFNNRPEAYIVPPLFALIFIIGVLGNGTLIVVFLRVRPMRNVPNTYILSLAIADLLVIMTTVPITTIVYAFDSYPLSSTYCKLSEFMKDISIGVSVFTLTALSGDRYFAIVHPLRKFHAHGGGRSATRITIAIAISIWILGIVCAIPQLIGCEILEFSSVKGTINICYPFPREWGEGYAKLMVLSRFLIYYAIPLFIIGLFYIMIARHLVYTANVPGETQGTMRQIIARRKVAMTVLAFVVIFGICFFPIHLFMMWFYFHPSSRENYGTFWNIFRIFGFCLSFANSCANPIALYFVSGAFRKHFNRYLFCKGSASGRARNGELLAHRDTSMTSTASRRYNSRKSYHQSTIRRLQDTTITMIPSRCAENGNDCDDEYCVSPI